MSKKQLFRKSLHLVENWLDYQTYIKEIPGIAIGIYVEDETIFQKEYGYANLETKEKLTDQHLFRIASHSKLFTATAIMKLYHENKLSIDDKIVQYLPWFNSEDDENIQQIRIRHLLTHSSGITRDGQTAHWSTYKFPELEEIKNQVKKGISYFEISEQLKYSNFGFTLLGQIIEAVSGKTYEEYIQEEIFEPLEMKNTVIDINEENIDRHATGYKRKFPKQEREKFEHVPAKVMHAATGLSSTVSDLIKFYKAHMFGNNILFPDYIKREMQRIQFKGEEADWGLGFGIRKVDKISFVGHGGGYPGFITQSGLNQEDKTIVVVLTNAVDGPARALIMGIMKILHYMKKKKEKLEKKEQEEKQESDLSKIIGFYASDWSTILFSNLNSKLISVDPSADDPTENLQMYKQEKDYEFITPKQPPFASPGQKIRFIEDPEGEYILIDSHGAKVKRFTFTY